MGRVELCGIPGWADEEGAGRKTGGSINEATKEYANRAVSADWQVRDIPISQARAIVTLHHYARGASNTAVYLHGLYYVLDDSPSGCAWWLPPTRSAAEATYSQRWQGVLSLSRLVLIPGMPKNSCSILWARSRALIDPVKWPCLVTYADEWQGHLGTIYKADNWDYCGMTKPSPLWILNGRMTARKATKTRTDAEMVALGAEKIGSFRKHKFIYLRDERGRKVKR